MANITIYDFIKKLDKLMSTQIDVAIKAGLDKGMDRARALAQQDAMSRGQGGALSYGGRFYGLDRAQRIGKSTKRLWETIKVIPTTISNGDIKTFETGLSAGDSDVKYARIQEKGGTTSPHIIAPRYGKALMFWSQRDGDWAFAKIVHHPGSKIPARPYLRPAIDKAVPLIKAEVKENVLKAFKVSLNG